LPSGVSISQTGLITGTISTSTSGSFTVTASTGFVSQESGLFSYTMTADSFLLIARPESTALTFGGPIPPTTVQGLSYSGLVVSNFVFQSLPISYGLTIGNATGVIGGTFTTSVAPDPILPSQVRFAVRGTAGLSTGDLSANLDLGLSDSPSWLTLSTTSLRQTTTTLNQWSTLVTAPVSFQDVSVRRLTLSTRTVVAVTGTPHVSVSSDGITFRTVTLPLTPRPFSATPDAPPVPEGTQLSNGPSFLVRGEGATIYGVGRIEPLIIDDAVATFWTSTTDGEAWTQTFPLLASGVDGLPWLPNARTFFLMFTFDSFLSLVLQPTFPASKYLCSSC
jgi:hypothetical protein